MIYKVLQAGSPEDLNKKVNEFINLGYTPVGSHQCIVYSSNQANGLTRYENDYSQTMVKTIEGEAIAENEFKLNKAIIALELIYADVEMYHQTTMTPDDTLISIMTKIDNTLSQIK